MPEDEYALDEETASFVNKMIEKLEMSPNFADSTGVLYKRYEKVIGEIQKDRRFITATATLYAFSKRTKTPYTLDEIVDASEPPVSRIDVGRSYNKLR